MFCKIVKQCSLAGSPAAPEEQLEDGCQDVLRDGPHLDRRRRVLWPGELRGVAISRNRALILYHWPIGEKRGNFG